MDSSEEMLSVVISGVSGGPGGNLYDLLTDFDGACEDLALAGVLGAPDVGSCRGKEKWFVGCDSIIMGVGG